VKEVKEKERFEVLLEDIKDKVQLVLEGHGTLDNKIENVRQELGGKIEAVKSDLKQELGGKMDHLDEKVERFGKHLSATAVASYALLSDVQKDDQGVKQQLDEHVCQPVHR